MDIYARYYVTVARNDGRRVFAVASFFRFIRMVLTDCKNISEIDDEFLEDVVYPRLVELAAGFAFLAEDDADKREEWLNKYRPTWDKYEHGILTAQGDLSQINGLCLVPCRYVYELIQ